MPDLRLELQIGAPVERVWEVVVDVERYPESIESVRAVAVQQNGSGVRTVAWSVDLDGSVLEWVEEDRIDWAARTIRFRQLSGDLESFDGFWELRADSPSTTTVVFQVSFEIGIPLLADMLNPVARRSLADSCTEMLEGIERRTAGA